MDPALQDPYDPEDEDNESAVTKPGWYHQEPITGGGETTPRKTGHLKSVPTGADLAASEGQGTAIPVDKAGATELGKVPDGAKQIPFNPEEPGERVGFLRRTTNRYQKGKNSFIKKFGFLALGSAGLALIGLLVLMLILINSLKIQNLAAHIVEQNMSRLFQDNQQTTEDIMAESLGKDAEDSAGKSLVKNLSAKYDLVRSSTWGKLDAVRPQKVLDNLHSTHNIEYNYEAVDRKILPGQKLELRSVKIGDETIPVADKKFGRVFSNIGERVRFAQESGAAFERATPETFGLIRSRAFTKLLDGLGIKLRLWEKAAVLFKGKNAQEAFALQQQESAQDTYQGANTEGATVDEVKKASEKTADEIKADIAAEKGDEFQLSKFKQSIEDVTTKFNNTKDGFQDSVRQSIESALGETGSSALLKVAQSVGGIYKIAFPACLIYEGSVTGSGGTIDDKSKALQHEGYQIVSGAHQIRTGDTVPEAVGAENDKLGNISESVPERIARGENVDTAKVVTGPDRPQAGGSGSLSTNTEDILTTYLGHNVITDNIQSIAGTVCPIATSPYSIAADLTLAAIIAALSGGTGPAAEDAAVLALDEAIAVVDEEAGSVAAEQLLAQVSSQATNLVTKNFLEQTLQQKLKGFIVRVGLQVGGITVLSLMAKMAVLNHANGTYVGLDGGSDAATQGAMGMELNQETAEQQVMMGRPQTPEEIQQNDDAVTAYLKQKTAQQSPYRRYFAVSNPNSLATLSGTWLLGKLNNPLRAGQLSNFFIGIFKGVGSNLASTATRLLGRHVLADAPIDKHYGIIQWGWSAAEKNKIENDPSYGVLANALYWEQSVTDQQKKDIQDTYGPCFTETIGKLLEEGKIQRDDSGKITGGTCSPDNLGTKNDLVFRYRLYNRNSNALNNVSDIQSVGAQP